MPTPVLTTKLFTPARRPDLVDRVRLWPRLDATLAPGNRLTLVSAPAGFGKTTSLVDWLAGLRDRHPDLAVAWLSLDAGDDDLVRLLTHLTVALSRAGLPVGIPEGGQPTAPPRTGCPCWSTTWSRQPRAHRAGDGSWCSTTTTSSSPSTCTAR